MLVKIRKDNLMAAWISRTLLAAFLLFGVSIGNAQTPDNSQNAAMQNDGATAEQTKPAVVMPVFQNYKDIKIGMTADEVKDKLGKAKVEDKDGFYYIISDDEAAQIGLDTDKKVRVISITYSGGETAAPKFADIFGTDAKEFTKPDGSVYNLVRYPEAGFWVAYSRTAGENPGVTVTMQKMRIVR